MTYPPAVSVVATSTVRWSGAGVYGGTIDVPAGAAEGDVLVVIAMHAPGPGADIALGDKVIDGTWTGAGFPVDTPIALGWRIVEAGEPASYVVDFAPHGEIPSLSYEQDGPAGNAVMLALRGVEGVRTPQADNVLYITQAGDADFVTPPDPVVVGAITDQHSLPYPGYDAAAVSGLDWFPPDGRPPAPVVIVAFTSASAGLWYHGLDDSTHWEHREQTCTWATPIDETGGITFTEIVDFATGPNLMVAVVINDAGVGGWRGNFASTPSAWTFADPFTAGGVGPTDYPGVAFWGRLDVADYPAPPPPPPGAGWYVGHPMGA